uniref:Uncharacterized protein n=1 Tax=Chromera velia CCMP2878 TaxID=1169474 RepID=A0A0G4HQR4_9ALVE|eukprot:Cvel_1262.t1-p1 / transcript=Cvel_1262.t1 / gene=Cvel_1262 / organism=Chromera_velia_CCMP2878 / gene_product=hypothetical protein / transcript_product=hypothetical protein / location=Cvel_scaffold42:86662-89169(-) / protein_length=328 / sequence_SO=supercontig / SO=protein_coding / is_pseudo=false
MTDKTPFIDVSDCDSLGVPTSSGNVLLLYHLGNLTRKSTANFILACLCIFYIGVNIVCLIINSMPEFREANDLTFHLLEFWATFMFTVVDIMALVYSPKSLGKIYANPTILKLVVFFNLVLAFIPAVLISIDLEMFELPSHEIEYANEITMAFVDLILLYSLIRTDSSMLPDMRTQLVLGLVALAVAVIQLSVYNLIDGPGGDIGETAAHFLEFVFEILSAAIVFWFTMDNKILCDQHIKMITHVPDSFTDPNETPEMHEDACRKSRIISALEKGERERGAWPVAHQAAASHSFTEGYGISPSKNTEQSVVPYKPPSLSSALEDAKRR